MTTAVNDDQTTGEQGTTNPVEVRQPGEGGIHEWLPYAVAAVAAVLVVLMFIAIANQKPDAPATSKPSTGGGGAPQLTTTMAPTSFSITCTLTKGPGYQTVAGEITSNASSPADVTVTYDLLDATGTRVLGNTKTFKGVTKGSPAPWQSPERGTPAGNSCTAKITAVTAAG